MGYLNLTLVVSLSFSIGFVMHGKCVRSLLVQPWESDSVVQALEPDRRNASKSRPENTHPDGGAQQHSTVWIPGA